MTRNNLALLSDLQAAFPAITWQILTKQDMRGWGLRRLVGSLRERPWSVVAVEDKDSEVRRRVDLYRLLLLVARARSRWLLATRGAEVEARSLPLAMAWGQMVIALVAEAWSSGRAILSAYWMIWRLRKSASPSKASPGSGRRVAMLRTQFWFGVQAGGSVSHVRGVASGMRDLGLEPHLWTSSRLPGSEIELPQTEIPPDPRPSLLEDAAMAGFNRTFVRKARTALTTLRPALIYQRHDVFNLSGLALARLFRVPLVLEVNASEVWAREAWSRLFLKSLARTMEQVAFRKAERLVLISDELVPTILALGGSQDRIVVSPNGVEVDRFNPHVAPDVAKRELGMPTTGVLCGFLGTFTRWHGVRFLAEQAPILAVANPRLHFLFIGDGDLKPEVESLLRTTGVAHRAQFTGLIPPEEVPRYLAACDILLSPHLPFEDGTEFFGSPTKLFEYMAAGRAIVASRLGPIARILEDGQTGILVPPGDGEAFRAALLHLADHPEERGRLGRRARDAVENLYTWKANVRRALEGLIELPASPVTMSDIDLKSRVQAYWDAQPCGTQFTHLAWGSREFFDAVREERYRRQPFMAEAVGFARYPGKDLLEIGCGLGTDLFEFARHGSRVVGMDLTPASVALARIRFEMDGIPGRFLVGDAEQLPFLDDRFDVVYSFGVLHHTPDTRRALGEIRRVLRPGGEVVVMLYHSHSSHFYLGYPLALLSRLRSGRGSLSKAEYFRIYDGEENPLGKAYTRSQVARDLFGDFEILEQKTYDTFRPHLSKFANRILLSLGSRFGFYLITRARKPTR